MRFRSTDPPTGRPAEARRDLDTTRAFARRLMRRPSMASRITGAGYAGDDSAPPDDGLPRDPLGRVEAVLLLSREPLSSRKLSRYANLADGTEARTLIRRLNEKYDRLGRAFRVEEVGGGFQLLSRAKFAPWIRRLEHAPAETRLSTPAMETLAVVAYRQPVLRAEIEAIRGVGCGEILRQLMERDMVRISGRSDQLGRPYLYGTTKRFLQVFGLRTADDLPRVGSLGDLTAAASGSAPVRNSAEQAASEGESDSAVIVAPRDASSQQPSSAGPVAADEDWDDEDEDDDDLFEDDDDEEEEFEEIEDEDDDEWEEVEDDDEGEGDDWDDEFDDDDDDDLDDDEEEEEEW